MIDRCTSKALIVLLLILCGQLIWPEVSAAQFQGFMWVDGIDGDSTDPNHEKWSDLVSYTEETTQTSLPGAPSHPLATIWVTKRMDKGSTGLRQLLFSNDTAQQVKLEFTNGQKDAFLKIELGNVRFKTIETAGVTVDFPTERLSLEFSSIKYTWNDNVTGPSEFSWDFH